MAQATENRPLSEAAHSTRRILNGIAVSAGIAIGKAQFINRRPGSSAVRVKISSKKVASEEARLEEAANALAAEFEEAKKLLLATSSGDESVRAQSDLLDAYTMICRDPKMLGTAKDIIRQGLVNAEWALDEAVRAVVGAFEQIDSPYLRERAEDVKTVGARIASRLRGQDLHTIFSTEKQIIFAHALTPADTLSLPPDKLIGLVTEMGGRTSHTGIMARSLHIPCVVGVTDLEEAAMDGELVIVDGIQGFIIINPNENELIEYSELQNQFAEYELRIGKSASLPAETEDGVRVAVYGNIEVAEEVSKVKELGGEGVGLFRTEYSYISRQAMPSEEELYEEYAKALKLAAPGKVVLRTLDIGADKALVGAPKLEEDNPALGLRAIRYSLRHQDIFRRQLRAMLRASVHGNAALMFPMISGLRELKQARSVLGEVRQELDNEGIPYNHELPVGTMIELPSAVFLAAAIAREVDFFSIGTNDLIQYTLGIDRGNKYVSYLYQPLHPAVIQAIRLVADAAHAAGITVCVCGEMAADPYCLTLLLALGIDEFSMNPQSIPLSKYIIRNLDTEELRELQRQICNSVSSRTTSRLLKQHIYNRIPDELRFISQGNETDI